MLANLHMHSRFSDGGDWPEQVAERAAHAGLRLVALTDHDSLGGVTEFQAAAGKWGLECLPAVEIDCREPAYDYRSELLAYFPSGDYGNTAAFLAETGRTRLEMVREAIRRATSCFPNADLSFEELLKHKQADRHELPPESFSFNKVDIYLYLKIKGAISSSIEYKPFKKVWFDSGLLGSTSNPKPGCQEIVQVVKSDGGKVVVPHIGHQFADSAKKIQSEWDRFTKILDYFTSIGVDGLELYWYRNSDTAKINRLVKHEAKVRGLFCTFGSDCHGPGSGKETMGDFAGDFKGFP